MNLQVVAAVARWEYVRFAKPRDLVVGMLFIAATFAAVGLIRGFVERKQNETREIVVWGAEHLGVFEDTTLQRFQLRVESRSLEELEEALLAEEVDALLVMRDGTGGELRVRSEGQWQMDLQALLVAQHQLKRLTDSNIDPQTLSSLTQGLDLQTVKILGSPGGGHRAHTVTVIVVVATMLAGLFVGFSYVFIAITGEKTQRVTESILSAITPQEWIDGKILGLTLVVLANLVSYAAGYGLYKVAATLFFKKPFELPVGVGDPGIFVLLLLFALLGFGFWLTFFAMIAATISDPNTSSRSSMIFLPFIPMGLVLAGLDQADALWMRFLSILPGISSTAMPVRLLRGNPGWWEILLSLVLLATMVWLFRRAAGRIFGASMLMTGKEPSWREVRHWLGEAN